ncbi:hypothetical protein B0H13DRAFT_1889217 [Mycena leptocephala]|nr:hypothetical protein B0H13DRAFT_1889217 [Mycena leptocephala]
MLPDSDLASLMLYHAHTLSIAPTHTIPRPLTLLELADAALALLAAHVCQRFIHPLSLPLPECPPDSQGQPRRPIWGGPVALALRAFGTADSPTRGVHGARGPLCVESPSISVSIPALPLLASPPAQANTNILCLYHYYLTFVTLQRLGAIAGISQHTHCTSILPTPYAHSTRFRPDSWLCLMYDGQPHNQHFRCNHAKLGSLQHHAIRRGHCANGAGSYYSREFPDDPLTPARVQILVIERARTGAHRWIKPFGGGFQGFLGSNFMIPPYVFPPRPNRLRARVRTYHPYPRNFLAALPCHGVPSKLGRNLRLPFNDSGVTESVTADALTNVIKTKILDRLDPKKVSAIAVDGGPNIRAAKKGIHALFCWILNIYDPSHNLNLFMKDIGRLFQKFLTHPRISTFMSNPPAFISLTTAPAHAILALEEQYVACADVFYAWVCIACSFEHLFATNTYLQRYRAQVIKLFNVRFEQMTSESSRNIFLFAYFLHPKYRQYGALHPVMPAVQDRPLAKEEYPQLFRIMLKSALNILKGETERTGKFTGNAPAVALVSQLTAWAYNREPFRSTS